MKNGFTMIELIFIIVILGILAAVAIPKLSQTHDEIKEKELVDETTLTSPTDKKFPHTIYKPQ